MTSFETISLDDYKKLVENLTYVLAQYSEHVNM